jgi:hypothetical protein
VVAVLPQPSLATKVLVLDAAQEVVDTAPSVNVMVGELQPSVAVAVPRAASISEAVGLQPRVVIVLVAVTEGTLRSRVHVTVEEAVAELPQPSVEKNVLVCEAEQLLVTTAPSVKLTAGVPQAAEAVAVPSAAAISEAEGLHPSVVTLLITVMVGGLGAFVHVTVDEAVAVLPQPSLATKVLVCDAEHEVVDTAPSVNEMVGVLQPSEAVAVPSAALIAEEAGLQPRVGVTPVIVITGEAWSATQVTVC